MYSKQKTTKWDPGRKLMIFSFATCTILLLCACVFGAFRPYQKREPWEYELAAAMKDLADPEYEPNRPQIRAYPDLVPVTHTYQMPIMDQDCIPVSNSLNNQVDLKQNPQYDDIPQNNNNNYYYSAPDYYHNYDTQNETYDESLQAEYPEYNCEYPEEECYNFYGLQPECNLGSSSNDADMEKRDPYPIDDGDHQNKEEDAVDEMDRKEAERQVNNRIERDRLAHLRACIQDSFEAVFTKYNMLIPEPTAFMHGHLEWMGRSLHEAALHLRLPKEHRRFQGLIKKLKEPLPDCFSTQKLDKNGKKMNASLIVRHLYGVIMQTRIGYEYKQSGFVKLSDRVRVIAQVADRIFALQNS